MSLQRQIIIWCSFINIFLLKWADAVPMDYCLAPMNMSDCGRPPTPVFSFYKAGTRCEIEIWRGCPSLNRFDNQVSCTEYCISTAKFDTMESSENKIYDVNEDPCEGEINTEDCGKSPISVYTYEPSTHTCIKSTWKGCKTNNMFSTEAKCQKICLKFGDSGKWIEKLAKLTKSQLEQLNAILDKYLKEENEGVSAASEEDEDKKSDTNTSDAQAQKTTPDEPPVKTVNSTQGETSGGTAGETASQAPADNPAANSGDNEANDTNTSDAQAQKTTPDEPPVETVNSTQGETSGGTAGETATQAPELEAGDSDDT